MKQTILIFLGLSIFSCGYFDDDGILSEKKIIGKINLVQEKHVDRPNLAFANSSQSKIDIIDNCTMIVFDTIHKKLFVEEFLNQYYSNYYQISVLDTSSLNTSKAYKMFKLEKSRFNYLIKKCNGCKEIDMRNK